MSALAALSRLRERGRVVGPCATRVCADRHAGAHALQAVDDDDVAVRKTIGHDAQAVHEAASLDGAVLGDVVLVDDEHELAEVGADRAIVDERHAVHARADEVHAREQARRELPVAVVEHRAAADRAVVRVDAVVDEVEARLVRKAFLVDEADLHDAVVARVARPRVLRKVCSSTSKYA